MRFANVVVSTAFFGVLALVSGCKGSVDIDLEFKERFVVTSGPDTIREDEKDWAGEQIDIEIQGVGVSVNGGVKVIADPSATKVTATARLLAMAFEKADADASIADVVPTYKLTHTGEGASGKIRIECGHGGTHGESNGGESGCEYVEVRIPAGAADQPLNLKVLSGNGTFSLDLGSATIASVLGNSNGGEIDADLPATQGGEISLVAEKDDITVKLPSDFAADEVTLTADDESIDVGPFTDIKEGTGAGGRGTAGTGLKYLHLTAKEFAGSTGKITLK